MSSSAQKAEPFGGPFLEASGFQPKIWNNTITAIQNIWRHPQFWRTAERLSNHRLALHFSPVSLSSATHFFGLYYQQAAVLVDDSLSSIIAMVTPYITCHFVMFMVITGGVKFTCRAVLWPSICQTDALWPSHRKGVNLSTLMALFGSCDWEVLWNTRYSRSEQEMIIRRSIYARERQNDRVRGQSSSISLGIKDWHAESEKPPTLPYTSPHTHTSPFKYLTDDESAAIKMSAECFRNEMGR